MELDTVSFMSTRLRDDVGSPAQDIKIFNEPMDYDERNENKEEYDDDEDETLLRRIPKQSNQSCSVARSKKVHQVERRYGETLLGVNYMYRTMVMDQAISSNKERFDEVIRGTRVEEMIRLGDIKNVDYKKTSTISKDGTNFLYDLAEIQKEQLAVQTNCEWLDCRLEVYQIVNNINIPLEQLISHLKSTSINVANDLMVFYHTHSDFALQILRMESYNLLALLKDQRLNNIVTLLSDGFSKYLFSIIKDSTILADSAKDFGITIPLLAEVIMNNYNLIHQKKLSLKARFNAIPKVVFYSYFVPSYIVMNGNRINSILDKKIISLQRKYFCKVILDGPFLRDTPSLKKSECFRFDILLDYQFNYWIIVKNELIKWMHSFQRSMFQCYIDKVCVSFVAHDFFCCDEIQNLMKRQHLLRDVDINFVKVIKWSKINQVDRSIL